MTWSVHQHWDPLKVCIVGRSYPPEFYSWITVPHVRKLFEKIAIETEEDYQNIIKKLQEFGVEVLRPDTPRISSNVNKFAAPPMTPRDFSVMIGDTFYSGWQSSALLPQFYKNVRDTSWPDECNSIDDFYNLPAYIQEECKNMHDMSFYLNQHEYSKIIDRIEQEGNLVKNNWVEGPSQNLYITGAYTTRIGKDLYFGTMDYTDDINLIKKLVDKDFPDYRNHIINTGGHSDGTYCPVAPGLIISLNDVPTYKDTFPDWEVVYLPGQSWDMVKPFLDLKKKNKGKWWIPGFEHDQDVINTVEKWLGHWTGYVEETVFDVNMLIIDPKNVLVFNYNKQVFDALERFGITPHIVPFRHRYFWDGGIHCVTSDLHREGSRNDYFPQRNNV